MSEELKREPLPLKAVQAMVKNRLQEGNIYIISQYCRRGNKWRVRKRTMRCVEKHDAYAIFAYKNGQKEAVLYQDLYRTAHT